MKKVIILSSVVFLIALLLKTPASIIASQVEKNTPVVLQGVSGSLWKGNAARVVFKGIDLGEASWTLSPLGLVTGSARGDFRLKGKELTANGAYKISISKTLMLDDVQFTASGYFINKTQRYAKLTGNFRGTIEHLEMQQNEPLTPPLVSGLLNWEKGGLDSPIKLPVGNYQLKIEPESEGKLIGKITANDAPVDIKGQIVLDNKWQYQADLKLKTTARGASLKGMLSMIGQPKADGYIHIKEKGSLTPK